MESQGQYTYFTDLHEAASGVVYTQSYAYDDGDNIVQMTLPSGRIIDYTRDGVRRVQAIDTSVDGNPQTLVDNIQYRGDRKLPYYVAKKGSVTTETHSH